MLFFYVFIDMNNKFTQINNIYYLKLLVVV